MEKIKYPRTYHFSFSQGASADDKIVSNDEMFDGMNIVITVKMDGENITVYPDATFHARSLDSKHCKYHSWLMRRIQDFAYNIPQGYRVCGEYLYAKHSISYDQLQDYFLVFSVWDENNKCLSWNETKEFCDTLGLITVPELYVGKFDLNKVKEIANLAIQNGEEGIVVRNAEGFDYNDFSTNIAKVVRKNHVQTDKHWSKTTIIKNKLKAQH